MKARVTVTLKSGVLDPQGKAIEGALKSLGVAGVASVRQGKVFDIEIAEGDAAKAEATLKEAAEKLLANTVIENYRVETMAAERRRAARRAMIGLRMSRWLLFAAAVFACVPAAASAQSTIQVGPPPGNVERRASGCDGPGWRYERRPPDVHMFLCQQDSCDRSSRVSYRLYAPDNTMTLERFRREQETVAKALEQRAPAGARIAILGIEATTPASCRACTSQRVVDRPTERISGERAAARRALPRA